MKSTVLLLVLGCTPAATRVGADHPASPDAPAGRVAGPPPALDPSKFEPPPPPLPSTAATRPELREPEPSKQPSKQPAKQPAKKPPAKKPPAKQPPQEPPKQPPGHDHHGHH